MRILAADDSHISRDLIAELLKSEGHELILAEDGVEAVRKFYQLHPDLVVVDIEMPKMSGYMVCRLIKEDQTRRVPVVILTARDTPSDRYWARKSGADAYLSKKLIKSHLSQAVRAAVKAGTLAQLNETSSLRTEMVDAETVLERVCGVLDRKLFEASVVADIMSLGARGMELDELLGEAVSTLGHLAEFELAALLIPRLSILAVRCDRPVTREERQRLVSSMERRLPERIDADALRVVSLSRTEMESDGPTSAWRSYLTLPLNSQGRPVAVLGMASAREGLTGEGIGDLLKVIQLPLATVVDAACRRQEERAGKAQRALAELAGEVSA